MTAHIADALARIEARAEDVRHIFESGFEPEDARSRQLSTSAMPVLDPLSVVAPDGTYFAGAAGRGRLLFTRDGAFTFADGRLLGRDGAEILGFRDDAKRPTPLCADPLDVALGRVSGAQIETDGSLTYERSVVDPRSGERRLERVVVGRLALARFPAGTQPLRRDPTHVVAPPGIEPMLGRAGDAGFGTLGTFARDRGKLNPLAGLDRLEEAYLAFDAIRASRMARNGLDRTALDLVK
jgi:hypothetical protein